MIFEIIHLVLILKLYLIQMIIRSSYFLFLSIALFILSGGSSFGQSAGEVYKQNEVIQKKVNTYRTTVFSQIKNGQVSEVQLNYGYEDLAISNYQKSTGAYLLSESVVHYLDLNEIECIYLMQNNFAGILEIVRNNGFVLSKGDRVEEIDPREITKSGIIPRYSKSRDDSLSIQIGALLLVEKKKVKSGITLADNSQEEKDFLNVFLSYEIVNLWDSWKWDFKTEETQLEYWNNFQRLDSLARIEAETFVKDYPNSEFNTFINTYILRELKIRNCVVGMDPIYLGTLIPTGELWNYIKVPPLYINLGLRVYYKKAFVNFMGGLTGTGLRQTIYKDTIWSRGVTMLTGDVTLGYCFDIGKNYTITPLVGVRTIANFGPKNEGKSSRFYSQAPLTFGMEFMYGGFSEPHKYVSSRYSRGRVRDGIGLKVVYQNPEYQRVLPELSGGIWTITLGLNLAIFNEKFDN